MESEDAFMLQQPTFSFYMPIATHKPTEAFYGNDSMAGNKKWNVISAASLADRTVTGVQFSCDLTIGFNSPRWNSF